MISIALLLSGETGKMAKRQGTVKCHNLAVALERKLLVTLPSATFRRPSFVVVVTLFTQVLGEFLLDKY